MRRSVARGWAALLGAAIAGAACRAAPSPLPPPALPQVSGSLPVPGITAPITIARDRRGIPHVTAVTTADLFFAQGFVQAQDRLFQMDLWRRAGQGRLAEVLGSNFYGRDTMTRRIQYHGDVAADWASYGPETEAIATAFVRGINAWVEQALTNPPEEFRLAGWLPERWRPEDLLNRTDAFLSNASALEEVVRARLTSALGPRQIDALLPASSGLRTTAPPGVDLSLIGSLGDQLRRVGTRPFFLGLMAPIEGSAPSGRRVAGSNAWVVAGRRTDTGAPILAVDPHRPFDNPSLRYLIHLKAPGWNVIGATAPWLPGVAIGHNESVAWGMAAADVDVQDLFVERLDPSDDSNVEEAERLMPMTRLPESSQVKGQTEPWDFERRFTPRGVTIGVDRDRHLAYALAWIGFEPGTANELAALGLDRAGSVDEFRTALARWKSPAADFVFADREGRIGHERAAFVPVRRGGNGVLPTPGWNGRSAWMGLRRAETTPTSAGFSDDVAIVANQSQARIQRLRQELASTPQTMRVSEAVQHDTVAWNASQLIPLLERLKRGTGPIEALRSRLIAWDRNLTIESSEATVYVSWEQALKRRLAERRVPRELINDLAERLPLVAVLTQPTQAWFDRRPIDARDALLLDALAQVVKEVEIAGAAQRWGDVHRVTFVHPLAVGEAGKRRFDVGPFALPGYPDTVFASAIDGTAGPSFRAVFDLADWDRSVATDAPGQSGAPASRHFSDLAAPWSAGQYFTLPFSDAAVTDNLESVLTLTPASAR